MKSGELVLSISEVEGEREDEKKLIKFALTDSGVGIEQDDQSQLFNYFGKVKDEQNLNPDGIGLGLMICKTIVENMDGKIGFTSQYEQGSSFWFQIPLKFRDDSDSE